MTEPTTTTTVVARCPMLIVRDKCQLLSLLVIDYPCDFCNFVYIVIKISYDVSLISTNSMIYPIVKPQLSESLYIIFVRCWLAQGGTNL